MAHVAEIEEIDGVIFVDLDEAADDDVPAELQEAAAVAFAVADAGAGAPDPDQANAAADIGILANNNGNNSSDDASSESSSSLDPITSRWDVYESIEYGTTYCGSCCYSDIADGTTTSPALPSIIGLRVSGVGKGTIPLSITDEHADKIKSKATKKKGAAGGAVYEVDADKVKIQNPQWNAALEKLVQTVAYKLGVSPMYLSAELNGLVFMEKGGYIGKRCSNDEEEDGGGGCLLGSLFIQLPSKFTGGEMTVYNTAVGEFDDNDDGESFKFALGSGKEATYSCHYSCLFADCEYEFVKLKSGSRILLQYSLFYEQVTNLPTASLITESRSHFKASLSRLPPVDRMVVIPLEKEYHLSILANSGINALSRAHREKAEAIKVAGEDWKVVIVNAKLVHSCGYGSHGDDASIIDIFDEGGSLVTSEMSWMKDVVDFDSVEHDGGMLLAMDDDNYCVSNWGVCQAISGHYDSKKTYRATFLVSYDPEFEAELKCLGGSRGVAEVCKTIVEKRDYDLLDRLLAVVETKEKSRFNVDSCQALLQMLVKSRKDASSRVALVKKIITGLSSSVEPDELLYDTIIEVVDKLGHEDLLGTIGGLLDNAQRKRHQEISIFLRRADFGLKLNERIEGDDSSFLEGAISDLNTTSVGVGVSNSATAVSKIMDLITEYHDVDLSSLVNACLNLFHRKGNTLGILMERTRLLDSLLTTNKFGTLELSLVEFAADFAGKMQTFAHSSLQRTLDGDEKGKFVKATEYVMEFGSPNDYDRVGKMAIRTMKLFSSFINAIISVSGEERSLLRDVLNKCLLQYSITSEHTTMYQWTTYSPGEPSVPPTPPLHVQNVLELYPNVVHTVDNDGRLPLHYATASPTASMEVIMEVFGKNKEAASIADPMTRLFPFQLAAASDNVEASFSLLLANPCLVSTGIEVNDKKRKRSQMSP